MPIWPMSKRQRGVSAELGKKDCRRIKLHVERLYLTQTSQLRAEETKLLLIPPPVSSANASVHAPSLLSVLRSRRYWVRESRSKHQSHRCRVAPCPIRVLATYWEPSILFCLFATARCRSTPASHLALGPGSPLRPFSPPHNGPRAYEARRWRPRVRLG